MVIMTYLRMSRLIEKEVSLYRKEAARCFHVGILVLLDLLIFQENLIICT